MRRRNTKSKTSRGSEQLSQSQFPDQDATADYMDKSYVQAARKKKSKKKFVSKSNEIFDLADQEVIDIHHGDKFVREHIRPSFMRRWDGQSNTLQILEQEYAHISPMMKVYWRNKSRNMNCIIFVQFGKMQFLAFEDDAIKLHQIFKKPLKKFSSYLMVNFWCKQIELAKVQLFQRRIPVLLLNEIEDPKYKQEHGIFRRQITQAITPSIFLNYDSKKFRQRLMMAIFTEGPKCGIACIDIESNKFSIQQFQQNSASNFHEIRRIINRYRPAELIIQKKDTLIKKIAKQICNPYIIQIEPEKSKLDRIIQSMNQLCRNEFFNRISLLYQKEHPQKQNQFSLFCVIKVLHLILSYMQNLKLEAKIFKQGIFEIQNFEISKMKPMFDAQVYENLQVFCCKDEKDSFGNPGTLYNFVDHCVTNSGHKLLKKWLDEPLRIQQQIYQRQKAIQQLVQNEQLLQIQNKLSAFSKLQKKVGDIYHWAVRKCDEQKIILTKDLKFDKDYDASKNPAVVRLTQINSVLQEFQQVQSFLKDLSQHQLKSQLITKISHIIKSQNIEDISSKQIDNLKGLPSIKQLTKKIQRKMEINKDSRSIQPIKGVSQIFDNQKNRIQQINDQLQQKLANWKNKLKVSKISYVSVRARNQIEVPLTQVQGKKFPQLIFSSQTSKFIRYVTAETNELSQLLISHEQLLAKAYQPFCTLMVKQFCQYKYIWQIYLNALSKIDVLMSLAKSSIRMSPRCLPKFKDSRLHIKEGLHPGLLQVKRRQNIVGTSLDLEDKQRILLLTGPNMGGKSTLLRQTCLLAILAQIGCYVPAEQYEAIVFDQIFCRIGASDRIIEGKSTFYVELEETKRIVDQATPQSLVIIDQLGRGTSTYDGMALASATLNYIKNQIQCFTLFSTHYFPITEKYLNDPQILCCKIGYKFQDQHIIFTYQLQQGVAERSFANQVAGFVGISKQSLQIASKKADTMQLNNKSKINKKVQKIKNTKRKHPIQDLMKFLKNEPNKQIKSQIDKKQQKHQQIKNKTKDKEKVKKQQNKQEIVHSIGNSIKDIPMRITRNRSKGRNSKQK